MQNTSFFTLFLLLLVTFSLSCCKEDPPTPEPPCMEDGLPCLTTEGKNMFACKVNGQPWIAETPFSIGGPVPITGEYNSDTGWLYLKGAKKKDELFQTIKFFLKDAYTTGEHEMFSENQSGFIDYGGISCDYQHKSYNPGTVNIQKLDIENRIISGYFEMTLIDTNCADTTMSITEGRFDFNF